MFLKCWGHSLCMYGQILVAAAKYYVEPQDPGLVKLERTITVAIGWHTCGTVLLHTKGL